LGDLFAAYSQLLKLASPRPLFQFRNRQIAHGFADAMLAAANDGYNITASLGNILEPKVLTIIICFVPNAKQVLGRDLWD
jgi:hypothetical protein